MLPVLLPTRRLSLFCSAAYRTALPAALLLVGVSTCRAEESGGKSTGAADARFVVEKQLTLFERWGDDPAVPHAAFELASVENRGRLGSVDEFRRVLETPPYRSLIDNRGWLCGEAAPFNDGRVTLVTTIDRSGRLAVFRYYLRPATARPGVAWAIDSVVRVPLEQGAMPGGES